MYMDFRIISIDYNKDLDKWVATFQAGDERQEAIASNAGKVITTAIKFYFYKRSEGSKWAR